MSIQEFPLALYKDGDPSGDYRIVPDAAQAKAAQDEGYSRLDAEKPIKSAPKAKAEGR